MSTIKVINAIHPSGSTNNIVNDASGNVTIGNNLTVTGTSSFTGSLGNITTGTISSGAVTSSAAVTGTTLIPTGSTAPTNGMYLPAANTVGWATNSTQQAKLDSAGVFSMNSGYGSVAPVYGIRAWGTFAGATGTLSASGNVTSVTRNTTGDYTVTLATAMPDANYAVMAIPVQYSSAETAAVMIKTGTTNTTTTFVLRASYNSSGAGYYDPTYVYFMVVR